MAAHYAETAAGRRHIEAMGGTVTETREGVAVDFPDAPTVTDFGGSLDEQIERAIQRSAEFGTGFVRLWRERGDGWYACTSHEEHPGRSYICQIDTQTGKPIRCECSAAVVCHHLGRAIRDWREGVGWYAADAHIQELIDAFGAEHIRAPRREEEEW